MYLDPDQQKIDWDGLWTLFLATLVVILGLGIPLIVSYLRVLTTARVATTQFIGDSWLLVFGKRLTNGSVDADYRMRLDKAAELVTQNQARVVVLLGGATHQGTISEAKAGLGHLSSMGITNRDNIVLEESSRNSLENLHYVRDILHSNKVGSVALISNRYHLARCQIIANSLGIKHVLCPAEERLSITPLLLWKMLIEAYYIIWFATGKAWATLTNNKRMLKRIT